MLWAFEIIGNRPVPMDRLREMGGLYDFAEGDITIGQGNGGFSRFHCVMVADSLHAAVRHAASVIRLMDVEPVTAVVPIGELLG